MLVCISGSVSLTNNEDDTLEHGTALTLPQLPKDQILEIRTSSDSAQLFLLCGKPVEKPVLKRDRFYHLDSQEVKQAFNAAVEQGKTPE